MPETKKQSEFQKAAYLRALLATENVALHLDPQHAGVLVPPDWKKSRQGMVLHLGYNMPVTMPDLTVTDTGVSVTLSFNRAAFFCNIPWDAVFLIASLSTDAYRLWAPSISPDLRAELTQQAQEALSGGKQAVSSKPKDKPKREQPSWMRVIDGDKK